MNFVAANKNAEFKPLTNLSSKRLASTSDPLNASDVLLLQPDESYAFAFKCVHYNNQLVGRNVGYPVIKWCNTMGETSFFRGDDTLIKGNQVPTALLPQPIKFLLMQSPARVEVYEEFEITIRLYNTTSYAWPVRLDCPNYITTTHSHNSIVKSTTESNSRSGAANQTESEDEFSFELQNPPPSNSSSTKENSLFFTGVTSTDLGSLDSNEYTDIRISLCATSEGMYDLPPIYAVHSLTKEKYSSGVLSKVLVQDPLTTNTIPQ